MHGLPHSTKPLSLPSDLDLEVYTEATRRALYDIVVAVDPYLVDSHTSWRRQA